MLLGLVFNPPERVSIIKAISDTPPKKTLTLKSGAYRVLDSVAEQRRKTSTALPIAFNEFNVNERTKSNHSIYDLSLSTCLWQAIIEMTAQPHALQQPDFNRIQQCHLDLASELNKCRNIPALDQGAAILNEIRLLREDVNKIHARLSAAYVSIFYFLTSRFN